MSSMRDRTWNVVAGSLLQVVQAHGPITEKLVPSATKRVVAGLRSAADDAARLLLPDGDENLLRQAAYEALAKRYEKLRHGHARLVDQHERLRKQHDELRATVMRQGSAMTGSAP